MTEEPRGRKSPEVLMDELNAMVSDSVVTSVELVSRVAGLVTNAIHVIKSRPPGRTIDPVTMLTHSLELTLASSAIVNAHARAIVNDLVTAADRTFATSMRSSHSGDTSPEPQPTLRFEGRGGERPTRQFVVENEYDRQVQVSLAVSALSPAQGGPVLAGHITFAPMQLNIGPRASLIVTATVDITEDFVIGQTYGATIKVVGFQAPDIPLEVVVLGPTRGPNVTASDGPRTKVAQKRKAP